MIRSVLRFASHCMFIFSMCLVSTLAAIVISVFLAIEQFQDAYLRQPYRKPFGTKFFWALQSLSEGCELAIFSLCAILYSPLQERLVDYWDSYHYVPVRSLWSGPCRIGTRLD